MTQPHSDSAAIQEAFLRARDYHLSGRFSDAEALYQRILGENPDHADSLDFLGVIACQTGKNEVAEELISRAIRINPSNPVYYSHLGNVFRSQGDLDEAEVSYRKAIALKPDYAEAHNNLGNVFAYQNRLDDAVNSFNNAIRLKHDLAEAYGNLGNILRIQGELDAAVESFQRLLALKPNYAEVWNNLGNILLEQGRLDEAIVSYRKAVALKPDCAEMHNNLGKALNDIGEMGAAVESYREALALKPEFAGAYNNLGNALREQGELDAAISCYSHALKLKPDYAEACDGLGFVYHKQGELDAAIENFRRALALNPDDVGAHIGLAGVDMDMGQFVTARAHLEQALALAPNHPAAWAYLTSLRKMTIDDLPWAEKAQGLLASRLKPMVEKRLLFALGKYNDDISQYEAAFGYYDRANRLKKQFEAPFDRDGFRRFVDDIILANTPKMLQQQAVGSDSLRPMFIVGMPRSGTSLAEQILASHPDIFGAGELGFWKQQADLHMRAMYDRYHDLALLQDIAGQCEAELQRHSASALRVVDKMPGNFLYLGLIHAVFPRARILHIHRSPIDTCLSIYFQDFGSRHAYANDLDDLACYYHEYHRLMAHWRAVLPSEVFLDVPYEALIEDQEGCSRKIIEFAGLEWDRRCLDFHETERKVSTASGWQVRQKIYKTSKERWRNYEKFIAPLLPLLKLTENSRV